MLDMTDLIDDYITLRKSIEELQQRQGVIEMELHRWMQDKGATMIPHLTHVVKLVHILKYDPSVLSGLREIVDPKELEASGAYTPAHVRTIDVAEKWNITKVKPFGNYGLEIKAIIEGAAYVSSIKLSITEKTTS